MNEIEMNKIETSKKSQKIKSNNDISSFYNDTSLPKSKDIT